MLGRVKGLAGRRKYLYNHTSWNPLTTSEQTAEARRLEWTPARYEILVPTWKTGDGRRGVCRRRASPSTRYLLDSWDLESRAIQGALPRQLTATASYTRLRFLMLPNEISRRWIGSVVTFRRRGEGQRHRRRERERKARFDKIWGLGKQTPADRKKEKEGKGKETPRGHSDVLG